MSAAVSKMAFGNRLGVNIEESVKAEDLFAVEFGNLIAEVSAEKLNELDKVMRELSDKPVQMPLYCHIHSLYPEIPE